MDEISESDCLVAIFTRKGMSSPSVNQEIGYALGREKPVIVLVEKEKIKTVK
jgi:nucleoside 2-deoxyribosyltransferase